MKTQGRRQSKNIKDKREDKSDPAKKATKQRQEFRGKMSKNLKDKKPMSEQKKYLSAPKSKRGKIMKDALTQPNPIKAKDVSKETGKTKFRNKSSRAGSYQKDYRKLKKP